MLLDEEGVWFVFERLKPWMSTDDYSYEYEVSEEANNICAELKMDRLREQLREKFGQ